MGYPSYESDEVRPGLDVLEALVAAQKAEIDTLAHLLGAVYPYIGFPFDPYKARLAWQELGGLMVQVEEMLSHYPGAKCELPDPGNVSELPAWPRPRPRTW
jgi:hypothetical protein